jgi:hypothetical protein
LERRLAPVALEGVTDSELDQLFLFYRTAFGGLPDYGAVDGSVKTETGRVVRGVFTVPMQFGNRSGVSTSPGTIQSTLADFGLTRLE